MEFDDRIIVIVAANGFLGRFLSRYFLKKRWFVRGIARREEGLAEGVKYIKWDGKSHGDWCLAFEGADAVVNLAGRTVNCRYNKRNKEEIVDSRTITTELVGRAIREAENGPDVWINSSTATIYRHAEDFPQTDEKGEIGSGFSVEVAKLWEKTFFACDVSAGVRKIAVRSAMVMAKEEGTVLEVLANLCRKGLGGKMASGKQRVSWVHVEDFCRVIEWMILNESKIGVYNVSSPFPILNGDMMKLVRKYAGVSFGLPATKWMLEVGAFFMQTETELILKSRWVLPTRLMSEGFEFKYEKFEQIC